MSRSIAAASLLCLILTACQAPAPPTSPTASHSAATGRPSASSVATITLLGDPEVVYRWDTDRCADNMLVDLPARAIRTADGRVHIYLSSTTSYRLSGADFDSLRPDCAPVLVSDMDRDPSHYNWSEWMGSPYTLDGRTVYAIIHEEYHGDQAGSAWQASGDFSDQQDHAGWSYLERSGGVYREMRYDPSHDRWQGSQPLCQIFPQGMHPDLGCEPTRAWTSPIAGTVIVNGMVYDQDPHGGNGIQARILKGAQELWAATIENGDSSGQSYDLQVPVNVGDVLYFSISARGDTGWDSTYFDAGINLGSPPCPSGRHDLCTLISLTYARSSDGGATFEQPPVPQHLIAALPYKYDPERMRALWQPSNIVKNPHDDFYYSLIQFDEHGGSVNTQIMCLMRTQTLEDPASWRAWDGADFTVRFIDPYVETDADPAQHTCAAVSPEVGAITYGLSYNSYLDQFIAVGVGRAGFYYTISDDLIHWSARQFLMEAAQTFAPGSEPPFFPYPTLIDHESPSASFDVTGQTPYLYFSRMNGSRSAQNMDLLRIPVRIDK